MAAEARLKVERKNWRKDHPPHFVAKPCLRGDGSTDLFNWDIKVPARESSVWYPALLSATMTFTADYPERPPSVKFKPVDGKPLFHPNVYTSGGVCMSIINPPESTHAYGKGGTWAPSITIKHVLVALQTFIDESTSYAAGRTLEYGLFTTNRKEYDRQVKIQVAKMEQIGK
jgi:ubiquitin-conjugating enzyme E2 I